MEASRGAAAAATRKFRGDEHHAAGTAFSDAAFSDAAFSDAAASERSASDAADASPPSAAGAPPADAGAPAPTPATTRSAAPPAPAPAPAGPGPSPEQPERVTAVWAALKKCRWVCGGQPVLDAVELTTSPTLNMGRDPGGNRGRLRDAFVRSGRGA